MIEYQYTEGKIGDRSTPIPVRCDGKRVGTIKPVEGGWQYFPINQKKGGEILKTITEVQKSLEQEETIQNGADVSNFGDPLEWQKEERTERKINDI